jgi:hypothetical protein
MSDAGQPSARPGLGANLLAWCRRYPVYASLLFLIVIQTGALVGLAAVYHREVLVLRRENERLRQENEQLKREAAPPR